MLANYFAIRPFQKEYVYFTAVCLVLPSRLCVAQLRTPHRAGGPFKSGIVYCLLPVSSLLARDMLHLQRVAATAAPVLMWTGSPALVHPILQTSGNDFNANFTTAVRTGDANSD
jgi:hypothetical protein